MSVSDAELDMLLNGKLATLDELEELERLALDLVEPVTPEWYRHYSHHYELGDDDRTVGLHLRESCFLWEAGEDGEEPGTHALLQVTFQDPNNVLFAMSFNPHNDVDSLFVSDPKKIGVLSEAAIGLRRDPGLSDSEQRMLSLLEKLAWDARHNALERQNANVSFPQPDGTLLHVADAIRQEVRAHTDHKVYEQEYSRLMGKLSLKITCERVADIRDEEEVLLPADIGVIVEDDTDKTVLEYEGGESIPRCLDVYSFRTRHDDPLLTQADIYEEESARDELGMREPRSHDVKRLLNVLNEAL